MTNKNEQRQLIFMDGISPQQKETMQLIVLCAPTYCNVFPFTVNISGLTVCRGVSQSPNNEQKY